MEGASCNLVWRKSGSGVWPERVRLMKFLGTGEISLLTSVQEGFSNRLQFLPLHPYPLAVLGADLAVLGVACRNDLKKVGELPDQLLGVGKHIFRRVFVGARVRAKETVRSLAKPGNDLFIAGGFENLSQSVERVGGAAVGRFFAGLAPLVKEGLPKSDAIVFTPTCSIECLRTS